MKKTRWKAVTYLSMYGGHNLKQMVRRLLKETVSSRLAEKYNFLGKKGKLAFGSLKLTSVLYECVQKNNATKCASVKEFEDVVKEWLSGAKDRDGERKKRFSGATSTNDTMVLKHHHYVKLKRTEVL